MDKKVNMYVDNLVESLWYFNYNHNISGSITFSDKCKYVGKLNKRNVDSRKHEIFKMKRR